MSNPRKKRVEDLPWVKEATIRKLYPDTLQVAILEKKPFAIWQHEGRFSLVDQNGKVIADRIGERYATLPVVVGEGAAKRADDFVALIDGFPSLKPMIRAGILVAGRRWNVMLTNGVEILLPELDPGSALTQVVALDDGHHILSRDIAAIDLRLPNRLVVRLTAEGTEARKAMLLDRAKLATQEGLERLMRMFSPSDSVRRPLPKRPTVVSILDIGSSKICCLIAQAAAARRVGRRRAARSDPLGRGPRASATSGRAASSPAPWSISTPPSRRSGLPSTQPSAWPASRSIRSSSMSLPAGCQSERFSASIEMSGKAVADADIGRVLAAGRRHRIADGRSVIHALPIGYSLDTDGGIADPRGMVGDQLGVDMHIVTGDGQPLHNLELCINRCHLSIEALVATPYASGLSVLVDDEAELGCACIDFGGGTTTIGVFARGQFVHVDAIAVGGLHITTDIARGLSTRIEEAERLKTMYGSALPSMSDDRDLLSVTPIGDDADIPNQVPRSALTRIIKARIEEILELVRDRLNASGYATLVGRRMVLTGGASQLTGLAEAARRVLARNIRLGRPLGVVGDAGGGEGARLRRGGGLLIYPQYSGMEQFDARGEPRLLMTGTGGYFARVGQWIRESF